MQYGSPGAGIHLYSKSQNPRPLGQPLKLGKYKYKMNELFLTQPLKKNPRSQCLKKLCRLKTATK